MQANRQLQDIAFAPALEQAALVRSKEISPVELVETYAARIEELNPTLNAYITTCLDRALDEAKRAGSTPSDAPFHGVPISIKDLLATEGVRTTWGSRAYTDHIPVEDAEPVRRIREAGFILLGKTNTPEFGTTPWTEPQGYGPARNPWDLERTPGGSSGGAAAAVAAALCPIAQGSDGGGSIRIPSSCCGVYGIKPSRGRVSAAPNPNSLLSQNGPIARTVADAAALLDVLAGYATGDAFWAPAPARSFVDEAAREPGRLRVAWTVSNPSHAEPASGNREGTEATATLLAELGHDVTEDAPEWGDAIATAFLTIWAVQQSSLEPAVPEDLLDPVNRALVELARGISGTDYARAWTAIHRESRRIVAFFDRYDVLVTPSVATPPPLVGEHFVATNPLHEFLAAGAFVPYTPVWNATGQPAVSIPLHTDEHGLPVGVQLVGRPGDEATLIRVSAQLEAARPWAGRRPPAG